MSKLQPWKKAVYNQGQLSTNKGGSVSQKDYQKLLIENIELR